MEEIVLTEKDYIGKEEVYCGWYKCPKCGGGNIGYSYKHCPDCGVKVTRETKVKP